ncbi:hypothetical protein [Nonomuraea sp. NPDC003709]
MSAQKAVRLIPLRLEVAADQALQARILLEHDEGDRTSAPTQ